MFASTSLKEGAFYRGRLRKGSLFEGAGTANAVTEGVFPVGKENLYAI